MTLTPQDSARLAKAFALLQQNRADLAMSIAYELASRSPASADAMHMLALCRKTLGDEAGALTAFAAALERAPGDPNLLGNYANNLARLGRHSEAVELYRRALAIAPSHGEAWMNLCLALLELGNAQAACAAGERAVALRPASAPAWHALGSARRSARDLEGAAAALGRAVQIAPRTGTAWTSLGVVRRLLGDPSNALECYAAARRAGFSGPELEDAEASAHLDLGDAARALEVARQLTASSPDYVAGHVMLAHLLWEHGDVVAPHEDPAAAFRAAAAAQPANRSLRLELVRFLIESNRAEEALGQVRALRADADSPLLAATEAHALSVLGDSRSAGVLFDRTYPAARGEPGFLNLFVIHLLKNGRPEAAAERALEALEIDTDNQPALAYLGVAWRLLGDPREDWLCRYDRLVAEVEVDPPPGFADQAAFLAALEATLRPMHKAAREPVNQSLRGGSQTAGVLFGRRDPLIIATREAISRAVARYLEGLPTDPTHPFLRRKASRVRFVGSWSVRLWSSGRHANHFHHEGWLSSAYYVSLPPSVEHAGPDSQAGCIQFGEPPEELGLELAARRIIRPQVGRLALFPSYLWHGTVPFVDEMPRLTIAFDAVPMPANVTS